MLISNIASQCAQLLVRAESDRTLSPNLRLELQNVFVRLKIWAGNVGIFAPENASVDYRLRYDADIAEVLISMLTSLKENLEEAIDPPLLEELEENGEPASEEESCSTSSSSALSVDLDGMEQHPDKKAQSDADPSDPVRKANDVIDRLYRLASVLRKPTSTNENAKVRDFIAKQRSGGNIEELEDVEDHARSHMQACFGKASKVLVDRLVAAAVFRRMKLRYRQRHQEKLGQGLAHPLVQESLLTTLPVELPLREMSATSVFSSSRVTHSSSSIRQSQKSGSCSVTLSATNASSVNRTKFANYASSAAMSRITRSAVARRQELDVPPPPSNVDDRLQKAICPYCFRMINKEEMREPFWTRHILKDIDPYVCLFEQCSKGDVLFNSPDEWLSHMEWQHTIIWSCQAPGHEQHVYASEEELEQHIRLDHPGSFTENQLPHLLKQGAQPAADIFAVLAHSYVSADSPGCPAHLCPICHNFEPLSVGIDSDQSTTQAKSNIQDHLLGHLESIALLSLPEREDADAAESNVWQSSDSRMSIIRDVVDLPPAVFEDSSSKEGISLQSPDSGLEPDIEVPANLEYEERWSDVFQQIKQSRLPEPDKDPLLLELLNQARATFVQAEVSISDHGNQLEELNSRLQSGRYINPLQAASSEGDEKVVEWLLEEGADVNAEGGEYGNALQAASVGGHDKVVERLLEAGADVNAEGGEYGNALQAASVRGHEKLVERLLTAGADINAQGGRYGNALQAASVGGHQKVVERLLEAGADINAQGGVLGNALQAASVGSHDKVVECLLEAGANINAQGGVYGNALQAASVRGHEKLVQRLLTAGADVNAQGGRYGNALQAASFGAHEKVAELLRGAGAAFLHSVIEPVADSRAVGDKIAVDSKVLSALRDIAKVLQVTPHSASAWARSFRLDALLKDGSEMSYLVKVSLGDQGRLALKGEFESAYAIHSITPDFVPRPVACGAFATMPDAHFYICKFYNFEQRLPEPTAFCVDLAKLHSSHTSPEGKFGFHVATYNGDLPQDNTWCDSWEEFFANGLWHVLNIHHQRAGPCAEFDELVPAMFEKVIPRLLRPLETGGNKIKPSLVHGDLWYGNVAVDPETATAYIFVPASFWAHNEYELGNWRPARNRFSPRYFAAYHSHVPKAAPEEDYDDRNALYAMRFNLHAATLFPWMPAFRDMVIEEMKRLVAKYPEGYVKL